MQNALCEQLKYALVYSQQKKIENSVDDEVNFLYQRDLMSSVQEGVYTEENKKDSNSENQSVYSEINN